MMKIRHWLAGTTANVNKTGSESRKKLGVCAILKDMLTETDGKLVERPRTGLATLCNGPLWLFSAGKEFVQGTGWAEAGWSIFQIAGVVQLNFIAWGKICFVDLTYLGM
jgi:hypothetical protein